MARVQGEGLEVPLPGDSTVRENHFKEFVILRRTEHPGKCHTEEGLAWIYVTEHVI